MFYYRIFVDWDAPAEARDMLAAGAPGHEIRYARAAVPSPMDPPVPDSQLDRADIVFGQPDPAAVGRAENLKWMHITSSGITRYDTPEFRALLARRGIALTHSPTVYRDACADHALCFLLAQSRRLTEALHSRAAGGSAAWTALRASSVPLRGQRVVLLGFGAIGSRLVELLRPFDMSVIAYRRHPRGAEGVPVVGPEDLLQELGRADHVINILPESAETRLFFDAAKLAAIRPGAVFYNIGRGATADQNALLEALRSGRLEAAWLDVTDPEPLPDDHPLRKEPRCHITPHIAGGHAGEPNRLVCHFLDNLNRFIRREPLLDRWA